MRFPTVFRGAAALLTLAAVYACADGATPTAPSARDVSEVSFAKTRTPSGHAKKLASCKLQKDQSRTVVIDGRGGRLDIGDNSLVVPAGALDGPTSITLRTLPTYTASLEFQPQGLHFAVPATVTIGYTKCDTPLFGVSVVYVQADTVSENERSNDHPLKRSVSAFISHFSSYAVAY